jgi:hypothetical protein
MSEYYDDYDIRLNPSNFSESAAGYIPSFLENMLGVAANEGPGVAGTGIFTRGTNIPSASNSFADSISKSLIAIGNGLASPRGLAGLLGMLLGASQGKQAPRGGISLNLSPSKVTRKMTQGRYGPTAIHEFAANGGLMQAYASGGTVTGTNQNPLPMEDGGFVLTAEAVRNGGGPQGIAQLLPGAKLIRGPGTGTSDHIPATIAGRTPARVSNGEMYVPKAQVDEAGGARALYALMHQLQRSA